MILPALALTLGRHEQEERFDVTSLPPPPAGVRLEIAPLTRANSPTKTNLGDNVVVSFVNGSDRNLRLWTSSEYWHNQRWIVRDARGHEATLNAFGREIRAKQALVSYYIEDGHAPWDVPAREARTISFALRPDILYALPPGRYFVTFEYYNWGGKDDSMRIVSNALPYVVTGGSPR